MAKKRPDTYEMPIEELLARQKPAPAKDKEWNIVFDPDTMAALQKKEPKIDYDSFPEWQDPRERHRVPVSKPAPLPAPPMPVLPAPAPPPAPVPVPVAMPAPVDPRKAWNRCGDLACGGFCSDPECMPPGGAVQQLRPRYRPPKPVLPPEVREQGLILFWLSWFYLQWQWWFGNLKQMRRSDDP